MQDREITKRTTLIVEPLVVYRTFDCCSTLINDDRRLLKAVNVMMMIAVLVFWLGISVTTTLMHNAALNCHFLMTFKVLLCNFYVQ